MGGRISFSQEVGVGRDGVGLVWGKGCLVEFLSHKCSNPDLVEET